MICKPRPIVIFSYKAIALLHMPSLVYLNRLPWRRPVFIMPTLQEVPEPNDEGFRMPRIPGEYPTNSPRFATENWILSTPRTKTLMELDKIPTRHNLLAIFFSWLLLGGYMVLPGTFASLHNLDVGKDNINRIGKVFKPVNNRPLLIAGGASCFIGVIGMSSLSWIRKKNPDWLLSRIIT